MKVEIKVLPEAKEPYAVIYASEITPEIRRAVALLEKEIPDVIPVKENDSIIVLRPLSTHVVKHYPMGPKDKSDKIDSAKIADFLYRYNGTYHSQLP